VHSADLPIGILLASLAVILGVIRSALSWPIAR
jgi:hypothetical protein